MVTKSNGLTEVPRTDRGYQRDEEWGFTKGDVRRAFEMVFSPEKDYVLLQVIANKEAAEILKKYIGFREDMDHPWEVRELRPGEKARYVPGASSTGNGLQFDNSLMDSYLGGVNRMAIDALGEDDFAHYPMVSTYRVHDLDRDPNAIFWPRICIVNAEKEKDLKEVIDNLSGDEALEVLRELESPQFYQMGEIQTLHKLGIAPLVRLEQELRVGAKDLLMYVDFLAQMTESYRWTGSVIDID